MPLIKLANVTKISVFFQQIMELPMDQTAHVQLITSHRFIQIYVILQLNVKITNKCQISKYIIRYNYYKFNYN
jgi:hypothetical protein